MVFDGFAESLLHKNVYYVCHTNFENEKNLTGDISKNRKRFFQNNKKTLRLKYQNNEMGYNEKVTAVFKKNYFAWKKLMGKIYLEEAFYVKHHFVVVQRDINNNKIAKIYYDKYLFWIKTEYYNPLDSNVVTAIIEPLVTENAIEVFIYNSETNIYDKEICYPVLKQSASEEQSIQNDEISEPKLLAIVDGKEYIYCAKDEQKARIAVENKADELNNFLTKFTNFKEEKIDDSIKEEDLVLNVENKTEQEDLVQVEEKISTIPENTKNFDFDISYDNTGEIEYIGNFKDGQKNGMGITFRKGDKAAKISCFNKGTASNTVAIFDDKANLNFLGTVENACKTGIAIVYDKVNNTYNITKNVENVAVKTSIFDTDGNLIYFGEIKNGLKTGKGILFDSDGNIIQNETFENDKFLD